MPPSFINGCLKTQRRKEKIEAAKMRIEKIRRPSMATNDSGGLCVRIPVCSSKRNRRDTDWEDFVIETLLLHQVKEEEIEKGYYNTLLDLHVFNSLIEKLLEVGTATVTKEEVVLVSYDILKKRLASDFLSSYIFLSVSVGRVVPAPT
ncbi:hypothetical protein L6452_08041 [Arctium lappa]|uniref:Uncharacterized protein n=1 Tax=Arctium lappa TaxID=4217 RepID=A0ACB9DG72_ARCLA|nr:hypothetical protein L6452_08041 [Arctium lappa]